MPNGNPHEVDFIQANGSQSQLISEADVPTKIEIDVIDLNNNIELEDGKIKFKREGKYVVIAAPQVGRANTCLLETPDFRCWLRKNDVNVDNSNVLLNVTRGLKDVIVSQGIIEAEEDDLLSVMMSSSIDGVVGVESISKPGEPLIPSIIITVFELSEKPGEPVTCK